MSPAQTQIVSSFIAGTSSGCLDILGCWSSESTPKKQVSERYVGNANHIKETASDRSTSDAHQKEVSKGSANQNMVKPQHI